MASILRIGLNFSTGQLLNIYAFCVHKKSINATNFENPGFALLPLALNPDVLLACFRKLETEFDIENAMRKRRYNVVSRESSKSRVSDKLKAPTEPV
jgi:hypothetical protein